MIKSLFRLVFLILLLGGWSLAALSLHVVRTPDKIGLIPKEHLGMTDTYVDARKWTLADAGAHPVLIHRMIEAQRADLFGYLLDPTKGDAASQLSNALNLPEPTRAPGVVKRLMDEIPGNGAVHITGQGVTIPVVF